MSKEQLIAPESTAVRVALWRALHLQIDQAPHVLEDEVGYKLAAPDSGWRDRPDMHPERTSLFRASILARSRYIEDFVIEKVSQGLGQYVILGAGLDSFAQRKLDLMPELNVFEVDQPGPQQWKRQRLMELGYGIPERLHFVPVDFEANNAWMEQLQGKGFDLDKPAIISSTGVSMYLTIEAIEDTLRQMARLAPGSTLVMSFILPLEFADPAERPGFEAAIQGARTSGTPFISFFTPEQMIALAKKAGFKMVTHVSGQELNQRYFANRVDGFRLGNAEALLIATT